MNLVFIVWKLIASQPLLTYLNAKYFRGHIEHKKNIFFYSSIIKHGSIEDIMREMTIISIDGERRITDYKDKKKRRKKKAISIDHSLSPADASNIASGNFLSAF